ncbi:MAG: DUF4474 domain-containing protein [Oscillospiraceae bacterium]|nr:DUF4474 domain-containing protein [Oscillospiraceae bacterium]MDD6146672.1 DUF4474 domain-containing protein [Oscillospiraceae bacterium]
MMKKAIKNSAFFFVLALILSLGVMMCSAAGDYEMVISSRGMNVGVGQSVLLKAEVTGTESHPKIYWSSSDESVATVNSNGLVKGKALGDFVITASAKVDGQEVSATFPMKAVNKENIVHSYLETNDVLSYQYSYDYNYYYANDKASWQKNFGFARVYDYVAPYVGMEYDYIRVFFNYDERDFLVQLWKGQYGVLYGGEIGIYNRDEDGLKSDPFTLYPAASRKYWPVMDMSVYHQEKEGDTPQQYKLLFKRPVEEYWWCTGFVPGTLRQYEPADELRIEATLTFRDEQMATLFADGLRDCGFTKCASKSDMGIDAYCRNGKDVSFSWQGISEAENTMIIKAGIGVLLAARIIALFFKLGWYGLVLSIFF